MKLTKHPDGRWEFEDVSAEEAMQLTGANGRPEKVPKKRSARGTVDVADLNESQLQTWQYLTAHDTPDGIPISQYAKDAELQQTTAQYRLNKLVQLGLAHRVGQFYRPGSGSV